MTLELVDLVVCTILWRIPKRSLLSTEMGNAFSVNLKRMSQISYFGPYPFLWKQNNRTNRIDWLNPAGNALA